MEVRYKRTLKDCLDAYLYSRLRPSYLYFFTVILVRVVLPIFLMLTYFYNLFFMPEFSLVWNIYYLMLTFGVVVAIIRQKRTLKARGKKSMIKILKKKPYVLDEQLIEVRSQSVYITFIESNMQALYEVSSIIDKNQKYFLYDNIGRNIAIIPYESFKSEEDRTEFLSTLNIEPYVLKPILLEYGLH